MTRARLTQLLDLTLLAPDLQKEILFLQRIDGVEPFSHRALRDVTPIALWVAQRPPRASTQRPEQAFRLSSC